MKKVAFKLSVLSLSIFSCCSVFASSANFYTHLDGADEMSIANGATLCLAGDHFGDDTAVCSGVGVSSQAYSLGDGSPTIGFKVQNGNSAEVEAVDSSCQSFANQTSHPSEANSNLASKLSGISSNSDNYFHATVSFIEGTGSNDSTLLFGLSNCYLSNSATPNQPSSSGSDPQSVWQDNQGSATATPIDPSDNLYRIDVDSPVFHFGNSQIINDAMYAVNQAGPMQLYSSSGGGLGLALPPMKLLANNAYSSYNSDGESYYSMHFSRTTFYYEGSTGETIHIGYNFDTSGPWLGKVNVTLPEQDTNPALTLNPTDFTVEVVPLFPVNGNNQGADVYNNGVNQAPVRVEILYSSPNNPPPMGASEIISPDYYPQYMYLYKQVFFNNVVNAASPTLMTNYQANWDTTFNNYTTIENYPGPYVADPSSGNVLNASSYDEGSEETVSGNNQLVQDSNMYSADGLYYVSTTGTNNIVPQACIYIKNEAVCSTSSVTKAAVVYPQHTPSAASLSSASGNLNLGLSETLPGEKQSQLAAVYNVTAYDRYNSAAVYYDQSQQYMDVLFSYPVIDGNEHSLSNIGNTKLGLVGGAIVNSDGSLTIPSPYGYGTASVDSVNTTVQDIYGNEFATLSVTP